MPRLPRDLDGTTLIKALARLGYQPTRTRGSHVRVTTEQDGPNSEVIPLHRPLKPGTLSAIMRRIATHHGLSKEVLIQRLFET